MHNGHVRKEMYIKSLINDVSKLIQRFEGRTSNQLDKRFDSQSLT